jgi:hypothetical protein
MVCASGNWRDIITTVMVKPYLYSRIHHLHPCYNICPQNKSVDDKIKSILNDSSPFENRLNVVISPVIMSYRFRNTYIGITIPEFCTYCNIRTCKNRALIVNKFDDLGLLNNLYGTPVGYCPGANYFTSASTLLILYPNILQICCIPARVCDIDTIDQGHPVIAGFTLLPHSPIKWVGKQDYQVSMESQ